MDFEYEGELVDWERDQSHGFHRILCRNMEEAMRRAVVDIANTNARPRAISIDGGPGVVFTKWPGSLLCVGFYGRDAHQDEALWKKIYPYDYESKRLPT